MYLVTFKEANDAVASERSIFSINQDYKYFFLVAVNSYAPIFWGLDACGGRKLITHTYTHRTTTEIFICTPRVNDHVNRTCGVIHNAPTQTYNIDSTSCEWVYAFSTVSFNENSVWTFQVYCVSRVAEIYNIIVTVQKFLFLISML